MTGPSSDDAPSTSVSPKPGPAENDITPLERLYTYSPPAPIITKGQGPFQCRNLQIAPDRPPFDCQADHRRQRQTLGRSTTISEGLADQCRNRNITSITIKLDHSLVHTLDSQLRALVSPLPFQHHHESVSPFDEFEEDWEHILDSDDLRSLAFEQEAPVCKCVFETNVRAYPNCRTAYPLEVFLTCRGNWTADGMKKVERLNPTFVGHLAQQEDFACLHYKRLFVAPEPVEGILTKTRTAFLVLDDIFSVEGMRGLLGWLWDAEGQWLRLGVDGSERRLVLPHSEGFEGDQTVSTSAVRLLNDALHKLLDHPSRARRVVVLNLAGMIILQLDTNNQVSVSSIIPADSGAQNVDCFLDHTVTKDEEYYPTPTATPTDGAGRTSPTNQAADTPTGKRNLRPTILSTILALSLFPVQGYSQSRKHTREETVTEKSKVAKAKVSPVIGTVQANGTSAQPCGEKQEDVDMDPKSTPIGTNNLKGTKCQKKDPQVGVKFGFGSSIAQSTRSKTKRELDLGAKGQHEKIALEHEHETSDGSSTHNQDGTNCGGALDADAGLTASASGVDNGTGADEMEEEPKEQLTTGIWLQQSGVAFDWQGMSLHERSSWPHTLDKKAAPFMLVEAYNPDLIGYKQIVIDRAQVIGNGRLGDVIGGRLYDPLLSISVSTPRGETEAVRLPPTHVSPETTPAPGSIKARARVVTLAPIPVALKLTSPYKQDRFIEHSYTSGERVPQICKETRLYQSMEAIQGTVVPRLYGLVQGEYQLESSRHQIWALVLDRLWELNRDLKETHEMRLGDKTQGQTIYGMLHEEQVLHNALYRRHFMYDRAPLRYDTLPGFPAARFPRGITDDSRCRVRLIDFEKSEDPSSYSDDRDAEQADMECETSRKCDTLNVSVMRYSLNGRGTRILVSYSVRGTVDEEEAALLRATPLESVNETDETRPEREREEEEKDLATFLPGVS